MKFTKIIISLMLAAFTSLAVAQQDISGVWEGVLTVSPEAEIDVEFSLESDGSGGYSGMLNAPDQPSLTDVAIDSIAVDGDTLNMVVSAVSGEYSGTISEQSISGTWTQQGQNFELNLAPYQEPVITPESFSLVEGTWIGAIKPVPNGDMELTIVLDFEQSDSGEYAASMSVPDQGASDIPADSFTIEGDEMTLEIAQMRLEIVGAITGDQFSGTFTQAGRELPLDMEKGEYQQQGLNLPALTYTRLQGPWHGQVGGLNVVIRVEQEGDNYFAYLDSPDQGASDIPITTLTLEQDQLDFTITAAGVDYSGEVSDDQIVGNWTQGGQTQPLTLERGPYVAGASLDLATQEQLAGTWRGEVNDTELVFSFSGTGDGFSATLSIPAMNTSGLGLSNLSREGDTFSFSVAGIQAQYSGSLSDASINGEWTRAGNTNPLNLSRE